MGQQQLLLLILSAIIVGLAIVTGINMFGENAVQANKDAVMQDMLTIASRAQGWYRRPTQLGGGGRDYNNVSVDTLDFDGTNGNGTFTIAATGGGVTALITGNGIEDGDGDGTPLQLRITIGADTLSTLVVVNP